MRFRNWEYYTSDSDMDSEDEDNAYQMPYKQFCYLMIKQKNKVNIYFTKF